MANEFEGFKDAEGMVWMGAAFMGCSHDPANREVTVEGGVGCANCGALLVPADEAVRTPGREKSEKQVKYVLRGGLPGATSGALSLTGEWDDLETAIACADHISGLGGYAAVFKVTTEEAETGVIRYYEAETR